MTNEQIKIKAGEVLNKYIPRGGAYKNFDSIMSGENIKFKSVATKDSFLGIFTHANNGQAYIMVNDNITNDGRRNFTIAHELGHYFLCHELKNGQCFDADILEDGTAVDAIEREANYFASCLLMPESKVRSAFLSMLQHSRKAKVKNFLNVRNDVTWGVWCGIGSELKKRYGVSEAALRYRLSSLELARFSFSGSGI